MSPPPVRSTPSSPRASRSNEDAESCGGKTTGIPPACCIACKYAELRYARSGTLSTVIELVTPIRGALLMALCYHGAHESRFRAITAYVGVRRDAYDEPGHG